MAGAHACPYCGVAFEGAEGAPPPRPPTPNADPEVLRLIRGGNKIGAIKRYRELTGLGLKESKEAIDEIEARLRR
jgi:ribosomal protein L7/L12